MGGGKDVEALVDKHMSIVGKMKRRMKQMLDVTEKYAVEDIFETINLLQQMSNKIKLSPIEDDSERAHRLSRRSQSLTVLGVDSVDPVKEGWLQRRFPALFFVVFLPTFPLPAQTVRTWQHWGRWRCWREEDEHFQNVQ